MASSVAHAAPETEPYEFTIDNGVRFVVVPDFRAPVVVHMVWYQAGSVDEQQGKTGIAHMLEHMMFKGTDTVPAGEFSKIIARLGGQDNAFTSYDYTAYYQKISRDNLAQAVEMETDRMVNLNITDEVFQPERDVVLEERNMRVDSRPISAFFELFNKEQYKKLPYQNPIIGWRKDIENFTLADAQDWYKRFYAPRNALVIMAGSITRDEAEWLAETYYAPLKNPEVNAIRPTIPAEPERSGPIRFEHVDERTQLPIMAISYRAPSLHSGVAGAPKPTAEEAYALYVLSDIMGGGTTSDLYQELVVKQKLADSVSANYSPISRFESTFDVVAQPKPGVTIAQLEEAILKVVESYKTKIVSEDELDRSKTQMKSADIFGRDDVFDTAYELGSWLTTGGTLKGYQNWLKELQTVTAEDVQKMAKRTFVDNRKATGVLRPHAKD